MAGFVPVVGIDLGTTFSAIAYIDEYKKPIVIANREGKTTTSSVVHFFDKDSFVVGDEALKMSMVDRPNTVSFIKRRMGDPDFKLNIYGRDRTAQGISALILKKLKTDAESHFRTQGMEVEVRDAVITVPAYFGMEQRGATKEAGELAGLNVLMIINEPTAAALAFGINKLGKDQTVFVFDLGGGTFDVTILNIKGNEINMVASDGDPELGGKDWDDALLIHCSNQFKEKYGKDPQDDLYSCQELYDRVLQGKISLSTRPKTVIQVSHEGDRENVEVKREDFEDLSIDLLSQCRVMSERVLEKANMTWNDIDTVLLVGGSTYMPMISHMIREISRKAPSTDVNPDHCVAIGAAYWAWYRFIEEQSAKTTEEMGKDEGKRVERELRGSLPSIRVQECVAKSLGIIVLDKTGNEMVEEMIPEQTPIPFTADGDFAYYYDNQTSIRAEITEGKGRVRGDVKVIGQLLLNDLPPRPKGAPIKVTYTYNRDKTLDIGVFDVETSKRGNAKVALDGSMTEAEKKAAQEYIDKMTQE